MFENLTGKNPNQLTVLCNGVEIIPTSSRFMRSMDTGADALSCVMPWVPGENPKIDEATKKGGLSDALIYLGNELQLVGTLYNVFERESKDGTTKDLEIFSRTADIIDSTIVKPFEANNITLTDRCKQQCDPFGIGVVIGEGVDIKQPKKVLKKVATGRTLKVNILSLNAYRGLVPQDSLVEVKETKLVSKTIFDEAKFKRVSANQTDKIFDHLAKLAAQRGFLLSCTKYGDLLITKANVKGRSIGEIVLQSPLIDTFELNYNGRDRYQFYKAISQSSRKGKSTRTYIAEDPNVQAPRLLAFKAPDSLPGEAPNAAEWRKNKSAADALAIDFPVNGWYGPDNKLWQPNTIVTATDPKIGERGFDFLINKVEFKNDENGARAVLTLKPPSAYTTGELSEPWQSE